MFLLGCRRGGGGQWSGESPGITLFIKLDFTRRHGRRDGTTDCGDDGNFGNSDLASNAVTINVCVCMGAAAKREPLG